MSIVWKFSIIYSAVILIPIIILITNLYSQTIESLKKQNDYILVDTTNRSVDHIKRLMKNTENMAEEILYKEEVKAFSNPVFSFTETEKQEFIRNFQRTILPYSGVQKNHSYKIRLYTDNMKIKETYDSIYSLSRLKESGIYEDIMRSEKKYYWSDLSDTLKFEDMVNNTYNKEILHKTIKLYRPIKSNSTNEIIAVLEINLLPEKFFIQDYFYKKAEMFSFNIIDGTGHVINPKKEFNDKNAGYLLDRADNEIENIELDDKLYRAMQLPVPNTMYKVIALVNIEHLRMQINNSKAIIVLFSVVMLLMIFGIVFLTNNIMFKRLNHITKKLHLIQKGNFNVIINDDSKDEIGQIAKKFNLMTRELQDNLDRLVEKEAARKDAEIKALHSQINPHFIYNALDNIRMECEIIGQYELADTLVALAKLLRYSVKWTNEPVRFDIELENLNDYMRIMQMRFGDKIKYTIDIQEEIMNVYTIKMMLQPIVENSFKHAFNHIKGPWKIDIKGKINLGGDVIIDVIDNGVGLSADKIKEMNNSIKGKYDSGNSIGLANVNHRIRLTFSEDYGIVIMRNPEGGIIIRIKLPYNLL